MATKFEQRLDELKRKYGSGGGEPKEAPAPSVTPAPSQPATGGVSDIQGRMFKRLGIAAPPSAPAPTVAPVTPAVQAPPVPADVQAFEEAPSLVQPMPKMPQYQPPAPVTPPLPATTPRYTGEAAGRLSALQQVTTEAPQRAKVDEQAAIDKFQKRREQILKQFTSSPDVLLPAMMDMEILPADFAAIPVEQIPWQKLQQAPQFKEAAKIGETDSAKGRELIIAEMEKREQSPLRQALRGFTHGAVEQLSFGAATPIATSGTPVERGAEFTGSVVGQIPLALGAGTIAGRVIPAAVTGPARAIAQGVGTGALLQTGREAVEAARAPGEFDLAKAAGRIGETAATYGAYMGIYSYLNPVVDSVVAAGAKRLGPAVQKAMESLPAEVVKGTVTGAAAGIGMGTLKAVAQGMRKEGFDLKAIGRAALEEAGQEASEEAVEAVALGIVSRLMGVKGPIDVTTTPTPAVTQPTTTEAPVAPVEAALVQREVTPTPPPEAPPVTPQTQAEVLPAKVTPKKGQSKIQRRSLELQEANPGMDAKAVIDMVRTTSNLSNAEFTAFVGRVGKPAVEAPTQTAPVAPTVETQPATPVTQQEQTPTQTAPTPQTQPTPTAQPTATKALYREVEAEKALSFIPGANVMDAATTVSQRYETSPGATRGGGILLEFDGAGLQGNTTADGAFAGLNTQAAQQESLRAITVKADAQVSKRDKRRYDTILSRLESQGWTKTENADGSVTYRRGAEAQPPVKERLRAKVEAQEGTGLTDVRMGAVAPAMRPLITGGKQNIDVPALNPDIEARFQGAKQRPPGESPLSKAKETLNTIKRYATSDLPYLPGGQRYARLAFKLRQLSKGRGTASDQAALYLQGITTEMRRDEYQLFNRAVVYNDLLEDVNKGLYDINEELPFGFTADDLKQEHSRVMEAVDQSEPIQRALKDRKAVMKEVTELYANLYEKVNGKPPPFNREDYFHHEVLNRLGVAPGRVQGTGEQVKTQKAGWQKARKGTSYDFLTNYLEAEHKVLAEMLYGIKVHQLIDFVAQNEDISAKLKEQAKGMEAEATDDQRQRKVDWRKLVPEGYKLWQPNEGNFIFRASAIDAHLVDQMMEQGLEEIGVPRDKIRQVLAIGGRKMELAIPQEIADTLDHFGKSRPPAVYDTLDKGLRFAMTKWKRHQLLFITRAFKYNVRNLSGDVDAVVSANPNALKKSGRAFIDLHNFLVRGGAPSAELEAWMERGGMQDVLGIAEDATQIDALKQFRRFAEQPSIKNRLEQGDLLGVLKDLQKTYGFVERWTNLREYTLRYAAFIDYLEQIQKNGKPDNWGASVREEVRALKDPYDMAYELSNDLLGAYDKVSVAGQFIRERFIPFWSWNEVNARRYKRIMENAFRDGVGTQELGKTIGRKLAGVAIKSPMIAYNLGKFVIKAHAVSALLAAWNYLRFRDEEDSLPETVRSKPHIIFGRDEDGKVVYFNRLGAVADFYEWFGLDASPQYVRDYLNGRMTMKEIAQDMVSSPVNKLMQGFGPTKTAFEWLSGKTTYPDFRKPRTIRDKREFLADSVGLGDAYRLAFGKPTRGAGEIVKSIFTYRVDPEEVAYSEIVGLKYEWLKKKKGMGDPGGPISPKSNALYYYKQALRYGDEEAGDKYLAQYIEYGGTKKGLNQSLKTLDPFYGMSKAEKVQFLAQLTEREKAQIERANEFYRNVLSK